MAESVMAFDFTLACSGYVYGLAIAQGLISSNMAENILLVNADTYSKYLSKEDRSVKVLFGDGAAVTWLKRAGKGKKGIIDIACSTYGKLYDKFIIPAGGCRMPRSKDTSLPVGDKSGNIRSRENIHMDGMGILVFISSKVPDQIRSLLKKNELTIDDIDMFVFHQASKLALERLTRLLDISPDKVFENISKVGNTVSASIPIALKDAFDEGRIRRGSRVLLSGFGVGLSWATAIYEV
jgi:3-oxoacyl-[acyl-carrier-protein] synthase-3